MPAKLIGEAKETGELILALDNGAIFGIADKARIAP